MYIPGTTVHFCSNIGAECHGFKSHLGQLFFLSLEKELSWNCLPCLCLVASLSLSPTLLVQIPRRAALSAVLGCIELFDLSLPCYLVEFLTYTSGVLLVEMCDSLIIVAPS